MQLEERLRWSYGISQRHNDFPPYLFIFPMLTLLTIMQTVIRQKKDRQTTLARYQRACREDPGYRRRAGMSPCIR